MRTPAKPRTPVVEDPNRDTAAHSALYGVVRGFAKPTELMVAGEASPTSGARGRYTEARARRTTRLPSETANGPLSRLPSHAPAGAVLRQLTSYQWFVFIVACLAWDLDCMDQQLFNVARRPAMLDLVPQGSAG